MNFRCKRGMEEQSISLVLVLFVIVFPQIVYRTISSPTFSKTSSTFIPRNYLREAIYIVAKIVSSYPPNVISERRLKAE